MPTKRGLDCDRTVIRQPRNLEEHRGLRPRTVRDLAQALTQNFGALAREEPAFAAFARVAQLVGLARWVAESSSLGNQGWLDRYLNDHRTGIPARIPKMTVRHERIEQSRDGISVTSRVTLEAGVSLEPIVRVAVSEDPQYREVSSALANSLSLARRGVDAHLRIFGGRGKYRAIVLRAAAFQSR